MRNRLSRLTHWLWQHRLPLLRLCAGALLLWLVYLGGLTLYNRLTASPAKWRAEMAAGQLAFSQHKHADALIHYLAAAYEARKFGTPDFRLAESLTQSARCQILLVYDADKEQGYLYFGSVDQYVASSARGCFTDPQSYFFRFQTALRMRHRLLDALHDLAQSVAIIERLKGKDNLLLAEPLEYQAEAYETLGEAKKVMPLLQRAHLIKQRQLPTDDPRFADNLILLANYISDEHRGDRERNDFNYCRSILPLEQQAYGILTKHPRNIREVWTITNELVKCYENLGDKTQAVSLWEKSIASIEQDPQLCRPSSNLAWVYDSLGSQYEKMNDTDKALGAYRHGALICEQCSKTDWENRRAFRSFERICEQTHNTAEMERLFQEIHAIRATLHGPKSDSISNLYWEVGVFYDGQGDHQKGFAYMNRALALAEQMHGKNWAGTSGMRTLLSNTYRKYGKIAEAEKLEAQNKAFEGHWTFTPADKSDGQLR